MILKENFIYHLIILKNNYYNFPIYQYLSVFNLNYHLRLDDLQDALQEHFITFKY